MTDNAINHHIRGAGSRPTAPPPSQRHPHTHAAMNAIIRRQPEPGLINPDDAEAYLDPAGWTGPGGEVDEEAKAQAVSRLIEERPYLAGAAPPPPPSTPTVPAGARGSIEEPAPNMSDVIRGEVSARRQLADREAVVAMRARPRPDDAA